MSSTDLAQTAPEVLADEIVSSGNDEWVDAFTEALGQRRAANQAQRVFDSWGISFSEAGRLFGVSRQAVGKWVSDGVPATQVAAFADLAAANDLLVHYLKADRIAAVVRRPISALDGLSLLDLISTGRTSELPALCARMFQFSDVSR